MSKVIRVSVVLEVKVASHINFVSLDDDGAIFCWPEYPEYKDGCWYYPPTCEEEDYEAVTVTNSNQLCFKV